MACAQEDNVEWLFYSMRSSEHCMHFQPSPGILHLLSIYFMLCEWCISKLRPVFPCTAMLYASFTWSFTASYRPSLAGSSSSREARCIRRKWSWVIHLCRLCSTEISKTRNMVKWASMLAAPVFFLELLKDHQSLQEHPIVPWSSRSRKQPCDSEIICCSWWHVHGDADSDFPYGVECLCSRFSWASHERLCAAALQVFFSLCSGNRLAAATGLAPS